MNLFSIYLPRCGGSSIRPCELQNSINENKIKESTINNWLQAIEYFIIMAFNYSYSIEYIQSCYNCLVIHNERKRKIEVNLYVNNSLRHKQVFGHRNEKKKQ
jgi:hypothetical protein